MQKEVSWVSIYLSRLSRYNGLSPVYYGIYQRSMIHRQECGLKKESNALYKHYQLYHGEVMVRFRLEMSGGFTKPMVRQINEAVRIANSKAGVVLNSKSEWHQSPLVRVVLTTGIHRTQDEKFAARGRQVRGRRGGVVGAGGVTGV